MKRSFVYVVVVGAMLALLLVACGGGAATQAPADTATEAPPPLSEEIPDDLPIIDGAYNVDVTSKGSNVQFQVDGDVETVLAFYQENLPNHGWEETRSPDSAIGAMGAMSRENEAGDSLTINMQYNPTGDFVVVQIALVRK